MPKTKKVAPKKGRVKAEGWGPDSPGSPQQQWEKAYEGYRNNLNANQVRTAPGMRVPTAPAPFTKYNLPTPRMPEGFTSPFGRTSPAKAGGGDGNPFLIGKKKR
jgi:hypothetical protein